MQQISCLTAWGSSERGIIIRTKPVRRRLFLEAAIE